MLIFLCLLLVQLLVAGEANVLQRIVNGKLAKERQFPYVVQILIDAHNVTSLCGGSIIANNWVLTAAHCTENATSVSLIYGSIWRKEKPTKKLLAKDHVFPHPQYNNFGGSAINDIALIRTEWVEFSVRIQSIPLPTESRDGYNNFVGQWAFVAGWGALHNNGSASARLYWAKLQVIDESACRYRYGNNLEGILCARSDNEQQSACDGDSGGPLVHNKELIGVLSFGSKSGCEDGDPLGFADVSRYLGWIRHVSGVGNNYNLNVNKIIIKH
ncbi:serine protease 3-like [Drosophila obscura]|uniref:serine protease 3-like n=1 Tax=Drosophila obscura TaxID=7282 RepID=UPI001BB2BE49|nr:serine protease 3-like [Drosophila obscura]